MSLRQARPLQGPYAKRISPVDVLSRVLSRSWGMLQRGSCLQTPAFYAMSRAHLPGAHESITDLFCHFWDAGRFINSAYELVVQFRSCARTIVESSPILPSKHSSLSSPLANLAGPQILHPRSYLCHQPMRKTGSGICVASLSDSLRGRCQFVT
jgi:hypothetical protein